MKRTLLFCVLACMSYAAVATSKPALHATLPTTPAGEKCAAWLSAFNSMDKDRYSKFITTYSPKLIKYIKDDYNFSVLLGGLKIERMLKNEDYQLAALVSEPYSDQLSELSCEVEATPPHLIVTWDIRPAKRPDDMSLPVMNEKKLIRALKAELERQSRDNRFSGVVLLAKGDRIVFQGAYGFSDVAAKKRNALGTRFGIASMGKMFTATAILQLAEQGKLDLHAPIGKYLPDYPNANIAQKVTLHHLLTHTGGTGDIFVPEIEAKKGEIHSHADYISVLGKREPDFPPGSKWDYSNYGFVLLGRIVEQVSGENYFDYISKHIYAAANMKRSGLLAVSGKQDSTATGYTRDKDGKHWVATSNTEMPNIASSAGGDLSTAQDFYSFARALQKGILLKAESYELLTRGKVDAHNGQYAYGFKDQIRHGLRYVGHGGSAPGTNNELDIFPDSGYIVVVLTNQDPPAGNRIADFIGNRLPKVD